MERLRRHHEKTIDKKYKKAKLIDIWMERYRSVGYWSLIADVVNIYIYIPVGLFAVLHLNLSFHDAMSCSYSNLSLSPRPSKEISETRTCVVAFSQGETH